LDDFRKELNDLVDAINSINTIYDKFNIYEIIKAYYIFHFNKLNINNITEYIKLQNIYVNTQTQENIYSMNNLITYITKHITTNKLLLHPAISAGANALDDVTYLTTHIPDNSDYTTEFKKILNKYIKYEACAFNQFKYTDKPNIDNNISTTDKTVFIVYANNKYVPQNITLTDTKSLYIAYHKYYENDKQIKTDHTAIFYKYTDTQSIVLNKKVTSVYLFHNNNIVFETSYNVRELYLYGCVLNIKILESFPMLGCLYLVGSQINQGDDLTQPIYINHGYTNNNIPTNVNIINNITSLPNYDNIYKKIKGIYDNILLY